MPIDSFSRKNSERLSNNKEEKFGRNTIRALTKPFVGTLKGIGKGLEFGGDPVSTGLAIGDGGIDTVLLIGLGAVTAPLGAVYGLGHGLVGAANSAVKGSGNLLGLREGH
jgi:hypothetical protein